MGLKRMLQKNTATGTGKGCCNPEQMRDLEKPINNNDTKKRQKTELS